MTRFAMFFVTSAIVWLISSPSDQAAEQVVDITTRPGVNQRLLVLGPENPKAVAILLAGGHGGLQIDAKGSMTWGKGNFLVRSRQLFVDQGLMVAVVDAPSDRQREPFLSGFRGTREHVADLKAVIAGRGRKQICRFGSLAPAGERNRPPLPPFPWPGATARTDSS